MEERKERWPKGSGNKRAVEKGDVEAGVDEEKKDALPEAGITREEMKEAT
jgi:hypothetical protein